MIENLIKQLIVDEGVKYRPYRDTKGILTVGVGRNLEDNGFSMIEMLYLVESNPDRKKRFPTNIKELDGEKLFTLILKDLKDYGLDTPEVYFLLRNDINYTVDQLEKRVAWYEEALPELKEILINMAFNLGIDGLLTFEETLPMLERREYAQAAEQLRKSKWYKQTKDRAKRLITRIEKLEQL